MPSRGIELSFLQLNKDKTEIIVFGAGKERLTVSAQLQSVMLETKSSQNPPCDPEFRPELQQLH